jgi:dihydrofolate synthase/folylpolyglutamate synthase
MNGGKMNYQQSETYVLSFTDYEQIPGFAYSAANYDLRRMDELLQLLGKPHLGIRTVHITGTKGKGSTAAMINRVLSAAGYSVGLYTSPHLHQLRERIRINDSLISEDAFASVINVLQPAVEKVNKEASYGKLTTFEILTAAAFTYFKKKHVDFQVLEVGLGGRLDATNVVKPEICIITSISLDHTDILGKTIGKIAAEKAGIIKPGCTVINFPQVNEALDIIEKTCRRVEAQLIQLGKDVTWKGTGFDLNRQTFSIRTKTGNRNLIIPLLGDYQLENASAAVAATEVLNHNGARVSEKALHDGLSQVKWPGRLQILRTNPAVVVDGAHNTYSVQKLIEAIKKYFHYSKCIIIFGASSDKDIPGMVGELASFTGNIIVTRSYHPRATSTTVIDNEFSKHGIKVQLAQTMDSAISEALTMAQKDDLIVVTGSLFIVAEAIRSLSS